jgi:hypothetical protein
VCARVTSDNSSRYNATVHCVTDRFLLLATGDHVVYKMLHCHILVSIVSECSGVKFSVKRQCSDCKVILLKLIVSTSLYNKVTL